MTKILVVISSKEPEKINVALAFSKNQKAAGHDIRMIFFGPSEASVANDSELSGKVLELRDAISPKACVYIAKSMKVEETLKGKVELIPAGKYITESVDQGYSILSF